MSGRRPSSHFKNFVVEFHPILVAYADGVTQSCRTKRRLAVRIKEHSKPKTPLMEHIKGCKGSDFSPTNFSLVARGLRGRESRKRYESIWIRYYDRRGLAFNVCESSRELQIF